MHFAGLAVKTQGEFFATVDEHEWFGLDRALNTCDALGLFGAQAHAEAHAVLGDHQAGFSKFFVAFIRCFDHFHAVFGVEVMRFLVEHVG